MSTRPVKHQSVGTPTMEGACVKLHRGIETITYVLAGTVEHGDSLGNAVFSVQATSRG